MPVYCSVPGCRSNRNPNVGFVSCFRFPNDKDLREKWKRMINCEDSSLNSRASVCIKHFPPEVVITNDLFPCTDGTFITIRRKVPKLRTGAYPTLNLQPRKEMKEQKKSTPHRRYRKKLKEKSPSPVLELESESLGRDDVRIEKPLIDRTEDLEDELAQIKAGLKHLMEEDPLHEPVPDIVEELEPERTTFTSNKKSKKVTKVTTTGSLRHVVESPEEMTVTTPHQPVNKISELSQKHSALLSESRRKLLAINRGVNRMLLPPTQHIVKPSALLRPLVERIGMTPIQSPRRPPQTVLNQTQNSFSQRADSIQRSPQNIAPKPSACVAPIQPSVSGANQPSICSYVSPRKRLKLATDTSETSKRSPHLNKLLDNLITLEEDIFSDDPDIQVIENTTGSLKKMRVNAAVQTDNSLVERKVLELQQKLAEKDTRIQQLEKSLAAFVQPGNLVCETNDKTSDTKYTIVW